MFLAAAAAGGWVGGWVGGRSLADEFVHPGGTFCQQEWAYCRLLTLYGRQRRVPAFLVSVVIIVWVGGCGSRVAPCSHSHRGANVACTAVVH